MGDYHDNYRLDRSPIGDGGQAEVFRAQNRSTGAFVALKRRKGGLSEAKDRMRREIEVQGSIEHRNVMPILDFDRDDYQWYTMPLAANTADKLPLPIDSSLLFTILRSAAEGLNAAHEKEFVHRDIKQSNLLLLKDGSWVVADWGTVRRPPGQTTAKHTRTGVFLGTEGFAPPEAHYSAHLATPAWDSYSLGRVAAWALTGKWPAPNIDLPAPEPWRRFVRVLTDPDPARRPQNMNDLLALLDRVGTEPPIVAGVSPELLDAAKQGDDNATVEVLKAAEASPEDEVFFIDELAQIDGSGLDRFVSAFPADARKLVRLMEKHFSNISWGNRDFDYLNVPLHWLQRVAQAAANAGEFDLLEDACESLFRLEPPTDRYKQAGRSRAWLASLQGSAATRVAQVLRDDVEAARYYGDLREARDPKIRAVLRDAARTNN
ncbi:MAG: eukaryotic-like serine/threonine-protein kinase [Pyrinomonadaceae bacterium]|jgi:serine/threonine-protein kinase|nr:eukaryotic-like serine/threonine-protein kinase [Pyrinomonadaceae bacterium]